MAVGATRRILGLLDHQRKISRLCPDCVGTRRHFAASPHRYPTTKAAFKDMKDTNDQEGPLFCHSEPAIDED